MVTVITAPQGEANNQKKLSYHSLLVFLVALDLLGGLQKLAEYRTLTWLPSLARACMAVVLKNEFYWTDQKIAEFLGTTKSTVSAILRADTQKILEKLKEYAQETDQKREMHVHMAGGLAKLAYQKAKEGYIPESLSALAAEEGIAAVSCDVPWAYMVLKHTAGIDFPIRDASDFLKIFGEVKIQGIKLKEVAEKLSYPIKKPSELLHQLKEHIK